MSVALQASTECLANSGDGARCMFNALGAATGGEALFALLVGGVLMLSLYVGSDFSIAPVSIGGMLLGGILIPALPAQYRFMGSAILFLGFVFGVFAVFKAYFMEVGR